MVIASAKIKEREGSTSPSSFYGHLPLLLVTRVSLIYLVDEFFYLLLMQLNEPRRLGESKVPPSGFWC